MGKQDVVFPYNVVLLRNKKDVVLMYIVTLKTLYQMKETKHQRPHIVWFRLYEISRTEKSIKTENRFVVAQGWGLGVKWEVTVISMGFRGVAMMKCFKIDCGDGWTTINILKTI